LALSIVLFFATSLFSFIIIIDRTTSYLQASLIRVSAVQSFIKGSSPTKLRRIIFTNLFGVPKTITQCLPEIQAAFHLAQVHHLIALFLLYQNKSTSELPISYNRVCNTLELQILPISIDFDIIQSVDQFFHLVTDQRGHSTISETKGKSIHK
jgi:hypothetical protein